MTKNLFQTPKNWLTLEDCEILLKGFRKTLERDEPLPPFNERFPGRLEGILGSVQQTYQGVYLNPTVLDASASYFNQFIRGHSFENGNKRLALLYTHWFLLRNNVEFTLNSKEMYNFAVAVAKAGEQQIKPEITREWCKEIIGEFTKDATIKP